MKHNWILLGAMLLLVASVGFLVYLWTGAHEPAVGSSALGLGLWNLCSCWWHGLVGRLVAKNTEPIVAK